MTSMRTIGKIAIVIVLTVGGIGCAKKAATAPVPGTINAFDAWVARGLGDAQTAILAAKTWELCSDGNFQLAAVVFDGQAHTCPQGAGVFPAAGRAPLFKAEQSYNIALAAGQAYHSGASTDTTGLTQAVTQLGADIAQMLTSTGTGK